MDDVTHLRIISLLVGFGQNVVHHLVTFRLQDLRKTSRPLTYQIDNKLKEEVHELIKNDLLISVGRKRQRSLTASTNIQLIDYSLPPPLKRPRNDGASIELISLLAATRLYALTAHRTLRTLTNISSSDLRKNELWDRINQCYTTNAISLANYNNNLRDSARTMIWTREIREAMAELDRVFERDDTGEEGA